MVFNYQAKLPKHWMCKHACLEPSKDGDTTGGSNWTCAFKSLFNSTILIESGGGCFPGDCHMAKHESCDLDTSLDGECGCRDKDGGEHWCKYGVRGRFEHTVDTDCVLASQNKCGRQDTYSIFPQIPTFCPMFALRTKEEVAYMLRMAWDATVYNTRTLMYSDHKVILPGAFIRNGKPQKWVLEAEAFAGITYISDGIEDLKKEIDKFKKGGK